MYLKKYLKLHTPTNLPVFELQADAFDMRSQHVGVVEEGEPFPGLVVKVVSVNLQLPRDVIVVEEG